MNLLPLRELHAIQGASFREYFGWEIVEDHGDPHAEYDAVVRAVGALDVSYVGKLRVSGRDRVRYLHNMLSNDVKGLQNGRGCYATLLTHQGRVESDLFVYAAEDELRLECSPAGKARLLETLRKYVVADIVTLEDATDNLAVLSLQGPQAREAMERTTGMRLEGPAPLEHALLDRGGVKWRIVHRDRTGLDGYDLWLPPEDAATVWERWTSRDGIRAAGHRALDWLRTEAGIPWFGVDVDERRLPMEVGLESALSMTKGCYRGQEIIARITYRAHLGRKLAAVALESSEPPVPGADVRSGGVSIGEVTSATFSPRLGNALALVILKSEFIHPGTPVEVALGETYRPARVTEVPLRGR